MRTYRLVTCAVVGLFARTSHAQLAADVADLASATVASTTGNLRVDLQCADFFATPDAGLHLTVDGTETPALQVNGVNGVAWLRHEGLVDIWTPTDVGFNAPAGRHHIAIEAPGCATDERDLDISPIQASFVEGRLPISDPSLTGPVGAPNNIGITIGAVMGTKPASTSSNTDGLSGQTASINAASTQGVWMSASYEHRSFVAAWDSNLSWGTETGTAMSTAPSQESAPGPFPFSTSFMQMSSRLRIGARLPLHDVALEAGSGLGGDLTISEGGTVSSTAFTFVTAPSGVDADWFVPVWAAVTIKPTCSLGVQLLASYDVRPTDVGSSVLSVGAGLMFQPSRSCSDPVGVTVR